MKPMVRARVGGLSIGLLLCSCIEPPVDSAMCTSESDCVAGTETCHPIGRICVPTCTMAADCPSNQKDCGVIKDPITGAALTQEKVCQCQTDQLCKDGDPESTLMCSPIDNICEPRCTTNADCSDFSPTRTCENGYCVPPKCSPDSCFDPRAGKCQSNGSCGPCTQDGDCFNRTDGNTDCLDGVCVNPSSSCNPSNAAPGSAGGPDTCAYGDRCNAGACEDVGDASCTAAGYHSWNQSDRGVVFYRVVKVQGFTDEATSPCSNLSPWFEVTLDFYAPNGFTYSGSLYQQSAQDLGPFNFILANGQRHGAGVVKEFPSKGAPSGRLVVGGCGTSNGSGRALLFIDSRGKAGNAICF